VGLLTPIIADEEIFLLSEGISSDLPVSLSNPDFGLSAQPSLIIII
jgi:hypothetical protein